jgi:hypothetical protein
MHRLSFVLCGVLWLTASAAAASSPDFSRDIQPIFQKRCYVCHGPLASLLDSKALIPSLKEKLAAGSV